MAYSEEEFRKRLFRTFLEEAKEHIQLLLRILRELEKGQTAGCSQLIEQALKEAHTLKGAARSADVLPIEAVCQAMESMLVKFPKDDALLDPSADWRRVLEDAVDAMARFVDRLHSEGPVVHAPALTEVILRLEKTHWSDKAVEQQPIEPATPEVLSKPAARAPAAATARSIAASAPDGTVRVSMQKLGEIMARGEELLQLKQASSERAKTLRVFAEALEGRTRARQSLSNDVLKLRRWADSDGDLPGAKARAMLHLLDAWEAEQEWMQRLTTQVDDNAARAANDEWSIDTSMQALLADTQDTMMMPCESLFESFPPMVRQIAKEQGKRVTVRLKGGELEADRRVLDEIKGGLMHIVRNAIDHGLETVEERVQLGKRETASLQISASNYDAGKVEIIVSDDGRGIDLDRLREAVLRSGDASPTDLDGMSDDELTRLIFRSGVSTSPFITDISGRGVGLAVLADKVERLGGDLEVTSRQGYGTQFRIVLPMSMARFSGLLVRADGELYILPGSAVQRAQRVQWQDVEQVKNVNTLIDDEGLLELFDLGSLLEPTANTRLQPQSAYCVVAILHSAGRRIACAVDEVIGVQEILVRSLGTQLESVPNLLGATVLADGEIVPILSVNDLIAASKQACIRPQDSTADREQRTQRSLIVEDSATSRSLLRNILESAGYAVAIAVDGLDAVNQLEEASFDLVVTDVEMPRMSGLELAAHIRNDNRLAALPIIIVSTLNSPEDRARGATVGANAYLVKSNFEQGTLLDTIRRLI